MLALAGVVKYCDDNFFKPVCGPAESEWINFINVIAGT